MRYVSQKSGEFLHFENEIKIIPEVCPVCGRMPFYDGSCSGCKKVIGRKMYDAVLRGWQKEFQEGYPYPVDGELFELTIDADDPACDPLAMAREDGEPTEDPYWKGFEWEYTGRKLTGVHTRSFRLVSVEDCRNLDQVRRKLSVHGAPAGGQWREPFKRAYPAPKREWDTRFGECIRSVGFADPSWTDGGGVRRFPYIRSGGGSAFFWADGELNFGKNWLWPVDVK